MSSVVYFALSDQIWYSEGVYYPKGYSYETAAGFVASKDSALSIPYDSGTWGECAVRCNTKSSSPYYFTFNSTAMNRLFPNATAHPTAIGAAVRVCRNLISGNVWHYTLVDDETILSCSHNSSSYSSYENTVTAASSSLVANATRNSTIKVGMRLEKNNAGFFLYGNVITQFTRYDFSATAGTGVSSTTVTSNCVSGNSYGFDGDTITYSCTLASGATFDGWYNGSTRVSTNQTYTYTVNGSDLSLTAKATIPTYNFTAIAGSNVTSATASPSTGQDGASITFSCVLAIDAIFDGWYSGSTKVSSSQTYVHMVSGSGLTLTAQAIVSSKELFAMYNGSQLQGFPISVSGDTTISYNGTEIATVLFNDGFKILQCAKKTMSGDVTIGNKTLQCSEKYMKDNVRVYIEPSPRFVCVGSYGYASYYSTDGLTWNPMIGLSDTDVALRSVTYGNDRFVCVGEDGRAYYSIDCHSWTLMSGLNTSYDYLGVTYGIDRFICVGQNGKAYYSINGTSWIAMSGLDSSVSYFAVTYGNNRFVCVGNNGKSYYSTDGTTWTSMSGLDSSIAYNSVTYGNGRFVCVGFQDSSYYSTDGLTWTAMSGLDPTAFTYKGVTYGNGRFVCVGYYGYSYYSTDGLTWTAMSGLSSEEFYAVAYGNGRFVCVGRYGVSYYSTDGLTWNTMSGLDASRSYWGVAYGG